MLQLRRACGILARRIVFASTSCDALHRDCDCYILQSRFEVSLTLCDDVAFGEMYVSPDTLYNGRGVRYNLNESQSGYAGYVILRLGTQTFGAHHESFFKNLVCVFASC